MATGVFPTATMSSTTLAELIPKIWAPRVNDFYRQNLQAANFFEDLSADLAQGGDKLYTPNLSEMTAHTKANATAVTLNNSTETKVTLEVTTWKEVSFAIEDREAQLVLGSYRIQEKYAKNAAFTAAKEYEKAILALFTGFSQTTGASTAYVADSNIRKAIELLDTANVPQEGRAFFFTPKQIWGELQAIDRFSLMDNTAAADPVLKGHVGMLYGIPVYKNTLIGTTLGSVDSALAHTEAIIHASTIMRVQSQYQLEYLSTVTVADVMYGAVENRDSSGVLIKTKAV